MEVLTEEGVVIHYDGVIMTAMASQIASLTIVYSIVHSGADQRNHQSSAALAFVWGIHRWPVNSPDKWRKRENVSIWWRHHALSHYRYCLTDGCDNCGTKCARFAKSPLAGVWFVQVTQRETTVERSGDLVCDNLQFVTRQASIVLWKFTRVSTNHGMSLGIRGLSTSDRWVFMGFITSP